jgi:hypothetical protein
MIIGRSEPLSEVSGFVTAPPGGVGVLVALGWAGVAVAPAWAATVAVDPAEPTVVPGVPLLLAV